MSNARPTFRYFFWLLFSSIVYLALAYSVPRQDFGYLITGLAVLFLGYWWVAAIPSPDRRTAPAPLPLGEGSRPASAHPSPRGRGAGAVRRSGEGIAAAILFRLLFLFSIPCLSDDVYRFVWDGRLLATGFNPYLYLPSALVNTNAASLAGLDVTLFQKLNSPDYFTVYPPVNQALFGLAAWLSGGSFFWNVVWLRLPIILSEVGTLWLMTTLLRRLGQNPNLALLYGLNPLVIVELTGNLHYEAVMIFFVLLSVWFITFYGKTPRGIMLSAGALAMGVATKLLPLLLLPLAIWYLGWRRGIIYAALTGGFVAGLFLPFASTELVQNILSSVELYFQSFEFNASVYYLLREIGYWIRGYNTIAYVGLWLSVTTTLGILWLAFRWKNPSVAVKLLATVTLYFALATTVHPWYICSVVAVAVFTRFRYPLVWSALIPLSYATYQTKPYHENLWLTALEYGVVVAVLLLEIRAGRFFPRPAKMD